MTPMTYAPSPPSNFAIAYRPTQDCANEHIGKQEMELMHSWDGMKMNQWIQHIKQLE